MSDSQKQNMFAVSMLAGVAGLAAGMLFAPRSGKETRKQLRETAIEAKDNASEGLENARERLDDKVDKFRGAKSKFVGAIRNNKSRAEADDKELRSPVVTAWDEEV